MDKVSQQQSFYIPDDVILQHTYSEDVANAVVALVNLGPTNTAYNIAGDSQISVKEYCDSIAKILNKPSCYELIPRDQFMASVDDTFPALYEHTLLLSNKLLKSTIGFQPTVIDRWLPITIQSCL